MKRVTSITLACIVLFAAATTILAYLSLSNKQGQLNDQVTTLELEIKTGAEKYTRCYYSVNNGSYMVGDVSLSHLRFDSTDAEKARLHEIESDFMNDVKQQCGSVIAGYESKYAEYQKKSEEVANTGWIAFLVGGNQVDGERIESLELLRFRTGDALTYFIFTKESVEKYFNQKLAEG